MEGHRPLAPKFLTVEVGCRAIDATLKIAKELFGDISCSIGILVPSMKNERAEDYPRWPDYPIQPFLLCEHQEGDPKTWKYKFGDIARCKLLQMWQGRNDDRTDVMPHLLFPGDTPFWGAVKRNGILVACSGFAPHYDKMFSGMIIDTCTAFAYDDFLKWKKENPDADFLE